MRITDEALYNRYAHFGADFIMRFFDEFPQFQHHFETFSIDVPIVEGQTMMICINGQLTEIMKEEKPRLAFSRLWMLAYIDGKPVIQNDQYHLSSLSHVAHDELKARPKIPATPAPAVFVPPVVPQIISSPSAPIAAALPIGVPAAYSPSPIEQFMSMTRLTRPYAEKCLSEAGNDMNKAFTMFKNVFSKLPPDALQK